VERDYRVDVEDRVGKCVVITSATPKNEQGGFYCEVRTQRAFLSEVASCPLNCRVQVCECTLKDSVAWLDHINGKKHNRALGYSHCATTDFSRHFMFGLQVQHEG
jgi:U4/U6.U5 tri-snRNP component SNU23